MTKKQGGKPAKFKIHERLNPLHPADDVTMEELEGEWGTPDDVKPLSEAELNRYRSRLSRKRKPPDFNGLTLPPKVVRDAWFGSESEKKPTTKRRNINPLYPPPDITKEEWAELEAEWGDPKDFKDDMSEAELELIRKKISSRKTKPY